MLLSARMLNDVSTVNSFEYADNATWTEGDATLVYLQLIDSSLDIAIRGFSPAGRRYMAPTGSSLSVQLQNIDNAKVINRLATQPFPEDASIWAFQVLSTDLIHGSPQMLLTLTEPGRTVRGLVKSAIKIWSTTNVGC